MLNKLRQLLLPGCTLLVLLQLPACGFHLRGETAMPAELERVHIAGVGEYALLTTELKRVLQRSGTLVLSSQEEAQSIISISNENLRKRVLSVDAQGRAAEYELMYSFHFSINKQSGEVLVPQQKIDVSRDFRFDPDNVLAKDVEEMQIRKDMTSFAVRQMMRRIESHLKAINTSVPAT